MSTGTSRGPQGAMVGRAVLRYATKYYSSLGGGIGPPPYGEETVGGDIGNGRSLGTPLEITNGGKRIRRLVEDTVRAGSGELDGIGGHWQRDPSVR